MSDKNNILIKHISKVLSTHEETNSQSSNTNGIYSYYKCYYKNNGYSIHLDINYTNRNVFGVKLMTIKVDDFVILNKPIFLCKRDETIRKILKLHKIIKTSPVFDVSKYVPLTDMRKLKIQQLKNIKK